MKTFSKNELEKIALEYVKDNAKEVYATSDGQVFYNKNLAENHSDKRKLTVYTFLKTDEKGKKVVLTLAQLTDKIADITDIAILEDMLANEIEAQKRPSAIKAIEERISKITK